MMNPHKTTGMISRGTGGFSNGRFTLSTIYIIYLFHRILRAINYYNNQTLTTLQFSQLTMISINIYDLTINND